MSRCLKASEQQVCSSKRPSKNPTRLLDIGSEACPRIRLCRTENKTTYRYVALSHCWGNGPTFTTRLSNLAIRKDGIEFAALPLLFQDAVTICRRLVVQYLWIDSLTIIQDSKHDWEIESHKMGYIYENAFFVISAVECAHSGQGILGTRLATFAPHPLEFWNTVGKSFQLVARRYVEHHASTKGKSPAMTAGPLNTRAWSLQEQSLCSKIFHFTFTEIVFESRNMVCCECRPNPRIGSTTPGNLARMVVKQPKKKIFAKWQGIVNAYSLRKLSFPSDRLPAISGMAERFQQATKSEYIGGLWVDNLVEDLLWSTAPFLENPHVADRLSWYRAPSFSWASVESQTHYELAETYMSLQSSIKVIAALCIPKGANCFGEVSNGFLEIQAPMLAGVLIAPTEHSFYYYLKLAGTSTRIEVCPDSMLVQDEVLCTVRRAETNERYRAFEADVMCVFLASSSDQCAQGLVLGSALQEPEAWERLGMFSCDTSIFQDAPRQMIKIV